MCTHMFSRPSLLSIGWIWKPAATAVVTSFARLPARRVKHNRACSRRRMQPRAKVSKHISQGSSRSLPAPHDIKAARQDVPTSMCNCGGLARLSSSCCGDSTYRKHMFHKCRKFPPSLQRPGREQIRRRTSLRKWIKYVGWRPRANQSVHISVRNQFRRLSPSCRGEGAYRKHMLRMF